MNDLKSYINNKLSCNSMIYLHNSQVIDSTEIKASSYLCLCALQSVRRSQRYCKAHRSHLIAKEIHIGYAYILNSFWTWCVQHTRGSFARLIQTDTSPGSAISTQVFPEVTLLAMSCVHVCVFMCLCPLLSRLKPIMLLKLYSKLCSAIEIMFGEISWV